MVEAKGSQDNSTPRTTSSHLSNLFCPKCPSKSRKMLTISKIEHDETPVHHMNSFYLPKLALSKSKSLRLARFQADCDFAHL